MGKFKTKKQKAIGLEIVAKEQLDEVVTLPESRKSDDKPLKKVSARNEAKKEGIVYSYLILRRNG